MQYNKPLLKLSKTTLFGGRVSKNFGNCFLS